MQCVRLIQVLRLNVQGVPLTWSPHNANSLSTSARFGKKSSNIHLVQIYSTSVNLTSCVFSKNSIDTNFALSE